MFLTYIDTKLLRPSKFQYKAVRCETLEYYRLRDSIAVAGILVPLLVRPYRPSGSPVKASQLGECPYASGSLLEVVKGHRRLIVANELRMEKVPVIVREMSDAEVLEFQVQLGAGTLCTEPTSAENMTRLQKIIVSNPSATIYEVANVVKQSVEWVSYHTRIVNLSEPALVALQDSRLSLSAAIQLAKLPKGRQSLLLEQHQNALKSEEFVEVAMREARLYREGIKQARTERTVTDAVDMSPRYRSLSEVQRELETPVYAAAVLLRSNATSLLEAFQVGLKWATQQDSLSMEERLTRRISRRRKPG